MTTTRHTSTGPKNWRSKACFGTWNPGDPWLVTEEFWPQTVTGPAATIVLEGRELRPEATVPPGAGTPRAVRTARRTARATPTTGHSPPSLLARSGPNTATAAIACSSALTPHQSCWVDDEARSGTHQRTARLLLGRHVPCPAPPAKRRLDGLHMPPACPKRRRAALATAPAGPQSRTPSKHASQLSR